jgi:hypothetical protein
VVECELPLRRSSAAGREEHLAALVLVALGEMSISALDCRFTDYIPSCLILEQHRQDFLVYTKVYRVN